MNILCVEAQCQHTLRRQLRALWHGNKPRSFCSVPTLSWCIWHAADLASHICDVPDPLACEGAKEMMGYHLTSHEDPSIIAGLSLWFQSMLLVCRWQPGELRQPSGSRCSKPTACCRANRTSSLPRSRNGRRATEMRPPTVVSCKLLPIGCSRSSLLHNWSLRSAFAVTPMGYRTKQGCCQPGCGSFSCLLTIFNQKLPVTL